VQTAIFVDADVLLRDSQLDPGDLPKEWALAPATLEAMRALSRGDDLVLLYGDTGLKGESRSVLLQLVAQVTAGGGEIDALIVCPHEDGEGCQCWADSPGLIWVAALQFDLRLEACYLLADSQRGVATARAAGVRAVLPLGARSVEEAIGAFPRYKDFPLAMDLAKALYYVETESAIAEELGHSRDRAPAMPTAESLYADPDCLPELHLLSARAEAVRTSLRKARVQLKDVGRWMSFFVVGVVGLGLGIAYLLTHLYREQPFPDWVYWVTLQFIPRPVRGGLFVAVGAVILFFAVRSLYRSPLLDPWRRRVKPR
jgi:histidinol phosphatase-like enzyme